MFSRKYILPCLLSCTITCLALVMTASAQVAAVSGGVPTAETVPVAPPPAQAPTCKNTVQADVIALDQPFMLNRLGVAYPQGMVFALRNDVVPIEGSTLSAGNARLRDQKRPRPIVLRVNQGDCLQIKLTNLLTLQPESALQPVTRAVSLHVNGMQVVTGSPVAGIGGDGSSVGVNPSSLVPVSNPLQPGQSRSYTLYADQVGSFLLYSMGGAFGTNSSDAGQVSSGLFGAVNVQPATAEYYRSQVTNDDLRLATLPNGTINYDAAYPSGHPRAGLPILKMVDRNNQLVHSDLTAFITGPGAGPFKPAPDDPSFAPVAASPDRTQPWREFTIIYHETPTAVQAFKEFYPPSQPAASTTLSAAITASGITAIAVASAAAFPNSGILVIDSEAILYEGKSATQLGTTKIVRGAERSAAAAHNSAATVTLFAPDLSEVLQAGQDNFAINYGTGGIGAEVLANRLQVGPMTNCIECKFEEFFLSSWAVGDPAMVVDRPANAPALNSRTILRSALSATSAAPIPVASTAGFPANGVVVIGKEIIQYTGTSATQIGTTQVVRNAGACIAAPVSHPQGASVDLYSPDRPNQAVPSEVTQQLECYSIWANSNKLPPTPTLPPDPQKGLKATKAFYADDPSNVYHSYLDDHVKFQILNAGGGITHVHHQHAHQWLHTPDNTNSSYLDSQMISPGAAFTLEVDYDGSGNRNKTVGDSIFHCHFYPHFAAGMWGMWRVHDVFEAGTQFEADGITPKKGVNRVLPDGEIALGTPIPAIVPLPTNALPPAPARVQVCPAYDDWQVGSLVGTSCVQKNAPVVGFSTMVNPDDLQQRLNPGYPFFIPGLAGHRAPHPPFDFAYDVNPQTGQKTYYDGGLPRHVIVNGTVVNERHNQWDFTKDTYDHKTNTGSLNALQLPEEGTLAEQVAMQFMGTRKHQSKTPKGDPAFFITNGLPRKPGTGQPAENQFGSQLGAPFADPGVQSLADGGVQAVGKVRRYKAAVIQKDVAFNKQGYHYPQQRFEVLWGDVKPVVANQKMPEPLFFRANSREDVVEFWHTNLVPDYYELDDYQVRTPTDILGQHIHLVKFDVMASDGAANGFNYEDGTLSPDDVRARIGAINNFGNNTGGACRGGLFSPTRSSQTCRTAQAPPAIFGTAPFGQDWSGAQTTVQRWYADPLAGCPNGAEGCAGKETADRTMRTVFTHDHFGPSTHQQAGLYSGLLIEPEGSSWVDPKLKPGDPGYQMGTRDDGGPTGWEANIITRDRADSYREFALEFQDLALTYKNVSVTAQTVLNPQGNRLYPGKDAPTVITPVTSVWGWSDCANAIGPGGCNTPLLTNPTLVSTNQGVGAPTVNYRSEPLAFRVSSASVPVPPASDLSFAFSSIQRQPGTPNTVNNQPGLGVFINPGSPPLPPGADPRNAFVYPGGFAGATGFDPYTPLLRAYQNDKVQVRVLVGAHLFQHSFGMHGLKWLFEPSNSTSGWRDNQTMGISEHFEMLFTAPYSLPANMAQYAQAPGATNPQTPFADYLYIPGMGQNKDLVNGLWGIMRAYNTGGNPSRLLPDLQPLPNNDPNNSGQVPPIPNSDQTCPAGASVRRYNVAAINTINGQPFSLIYNQRKSNLTTGKNSLVYVLADATGKPLVNAAPADPLVLRAAAGECIQVTLFNKLDTTQAPLSAGGSTGNPSAQVGLHPQLASYDITKSNGTNIGFNPTQTACPPGAQGCSSSVTYTWYAGNIAVNPNGDVVRRPVEFGSANLLASDPIKQSGYSMIGALVIEPPNAKWCPPDKTTNCSDQTAVTGTTADVSYTDSGSASQQFREFVTILQDNLSGGGFAAINFGSEPMKTRFTTTTYSAIDLSTAFSNQAFTSANPKAPAPPVKSPTGPGLCPNDPYTPVFIAKPGSAVRFRMLHPDGKGGFPDSVWTLHGHAWQEEPYVDGCLDPLKPCPNGRFIASARLGNNPLSQWMGSRDGFGPGNHFDMLIEKAGGKFSIPGDYLYRSWPANGEFINGAWGIFRVTNTPGSCPQPQPVAALRATAAAPAPQPTPPKRQLQKNGFERFNQPPEP